MNLDDLKQELEKRKGSITLNCRSEMKIVGVEEVVNFDEDSVRLKSVDGDLFVDGKNIKIGVLDTDRGIVSLTGRINGIYYANDPDKQKKGFFGKLLR